MWKEEDYKRMLYPIFQSVQEIHDAGYAHRDIKVFPSPLSLHFFTNKEGDK